MLIVLVNHGDEVAEAEDCLKVLLNQLDEVRKYRFEVAEHRRCCLEAVEAAKLIHAADQRVDELNKLILEGRRVLEQSKVIASISSPGGVS